MAVLVCRSRNRGDMSMTIARVESGVVVEFRNVMIDGVPPHKRGDWVPVVDEPPLYNATTHDISGPTYHVGETQVTAVYELIPRTTTAHVKAEAQRRIMAMVGAADLTTCLIKQLNANMRANELNDLRHLRPLTQEEDAEASALRSLAAAIKHVRSCSDTIEAMNPVPSDFRGDQYWT